MLIFFNISASAITHKIAVIVGNHVITDYDLDQKIRFMMFTQGIDPVQNKPSTLYGYSPRMRLDLTINILCYHAFKFNKVTIFGGKQWRPYLHIKDMVNFYLHCLKRKNMRGIYNISQGNLTLNQTADKIKLFMPMCKIVHTRSNDIRSYRLSSHKAIKSGFRFTTNINAEIKNLLNLLKEKKIISRLNNFSINWLKNKISDNEKK
jgi:nucleoside-diphosphate-sugar epimerase